MSAAFIGASTVCCNPNLLYFLQAEELRSYFKNLGAEISAERSEKGIEDDLHKIIGVCDACFKVRKI